jgi:hypothetical protein
MFSGIASRYDFANRVLSLGLCVGWREQLVAATKAAKPKTVADLATGSGDVAFALLANELAVVPPLERVDARQCHASAPYWTVKADLYGRWLSTVGVTNASNAPAVSGPEATV